MIKSIEKMDYRQHFLKMDKFKRASVNLGILVLVLSGCQAKILGAAPSTSATATTDWGNWNMNAKPFPGAGCYSGLTSTITTTNVCLGTQIFGASGVAVCESGSTSNAATSIDILSGKEAWDSNGAKITGTLVADFATQMASMENRDSSTAQVSLQTEEVTDAGVSYTNADPGYRAIPRIAKDDDGYVGGSVTYVDRTNWNTACDSSSGQPGGTADSPCTCGLSGTIAQRIANCATHGVIGAGATWNGAIEGNAGQGTWKLVTRTGASSSGKGREVWQDQRTLQIWSSLVASSLNWCKAAGSNNISGNPAAENDPSSYCTDPTYQKTSGQAVSACFEDDGTNFTQTDANIDPGGKGGLNRSSTPVVSWRLPTLYDYEQANIDGIRFVLPDMGTYSSGFEWTASVLTNNRSEAWIIGGNNGYMNYVSRSNAGGAVRCVGR